MGITPIEWTDRTWSPLRVRVLADAAAIATTKGYTSLVSIAQKMAGHVGPHCEAVSHGCDNCYACTLNRRCLPANGTGLPFDRRSRDLVEAFVDEKILLQPLRWRPVRMDRGARRPLKIFLENQSDLFGEWNTDAMIDRVFSIMALCPQHTFQVLTKRPARMAAYISGHQHGRVCDIFQGVTGGAHGNAPFPLPNVWLGVSCEDQSTAVCRIPLLLNTPGAKRFVSYEPALGPVDFRRWLNDLRIPECMSGDVPYQGPNRLNQIIYGGESGSDARPADVKWGRETVAQCRDAGVACFVKQLGARAYDGESLALSLHRASADPRRYLKLKDRKGGKMDEWPTDLRVREFPV